MKPKILVVDDEKSMQELLRNALSLSGFDVYLASNDAEFRSQALAHKPQAIILDILLGDKDGIEVYDELIDKGILSDKIPVLIVSALAQDQPPSFPQPGRRYSLLGKPFDCDMLIQKLEKMIAFQA